MIYENATEKKQHRRGKKSFKNGAISKKKTRGKNEGNKFCFLKHATFSFPLGVGHKSWAAAASKQKGCNRIHIKLSNLTASEGEREGKKGALCLTGNGSQKAKKREHRTIGISAK